MEQTESTRSQRDAVTSRFRKYKMFMGVETGRTIFSARMILAGLAVTKGLGWDRVRSPLALIAVMVLTGSGLSVRAQCLKYEPEVVNLTGRLSSHVFSGPPNYESIKHGDQKETAIILTIPSPVCENRTLIVTGTVFNPWIASGRFVLSELTGRND